VNAFLDRLRGSDPVLMLAIRSSRTIVSAWTSPSEPPSTAGSWA